MAEESQKILPEESVADPLAAHRLEQGEIDGLLKGANSDNIGVKALLSSSSVGHQRMPMLEVIFERFLQEFSSSLRQFTQDSVQVQIDQTRSSRFRDYMEAISQPSIIMVFQAEPWGKEALLVIDNSLIFTVVDILLGGKSDGGQEVQDRPYTTIERTLTEDFLKVMLRDLSAAFEPVEHVHFKSLRLESNPECALIERPQNTGLVVPLEVTMGTRGGLLSLYLPYATLEPARTKLIQPFLGEKFGQDKLWEEHLSGELWGTTIETEAILDQVTIKLSDVLKWKKGEVLSLDTFEGANIVVQCGDRRLYTGKVGNVRKRIAVQVEENLLLKENQS